MKGIVDPMIEKDKTYFIMKNKFELRRLKLLQVDSQFAIESGDLYRGFISLHCCMEQLMYIFVEESVLANGGGLKQLSAVKSVSYRNLVKKEVSKLLDSKDNPCSVDKPGTLLYIYWNTVYTLRNKAVHRGYVLVEDEVREACQIIFELMNRISDTNKTVGMWGMY